MGIRRILISAEMQRPPPGARPRGLASSSQGEAKSSPIVGRPPWLRRAGARTAVPREGKEREGAVNARILQCLYQALGRLPAHVDNHDGGGGVPFLSS
eukprot:1639962-Lingulodinium_polyedra.AAC.1